MLEKAFWFGLGYLTARYLILKSGSDAYIAKESDIIGKSQDKIEDLQEEYFPEY